jgi:iron complex outermembrane receptor protein
MTPPISHQHNRGYAPILVLIFSPLLAAQTNNAPPDYSSLSLQELSLVKVTSVSNTPQTLSRVAAAVYVISQEEIRRSGMTNVADLLRLVPGLTVARLGGSQWAVTSRGFNGRYANKLLVLIDGRSIYTPIFSGVYWDMCMPLLDDIDRIEVIRGPGASVWGANAVNGVINIITKVSTETQGLTITAGGGTEERAFGQLRVGGRLSEGISYRGYLSGNDRSALQTPGGQNARDGWSDEQGGFRIDGVTRNGGWQLEGDVFQSRRDEVSTLSFYPPFTVASFPGTGSDLAFEWRRQVTEKSDLRITAYYTSINRPETDVTTELARTADFEIQYHFSAPRNQEISVGLADRVISETVVAQEPLLFTPERESYQLAGGFAQDEIHLMNDRLLLTLGVKIEHSIFGGWQPQPTARMLWAPNKRNSAWLSFSRATRTPSFYEEAVAAETSPPVMTQLGIPMQGMLYGSTHLAPEILEGYEAGYRAQPSPRFSVDIATFYNFYHQLASMNPGTPSIVGVPQPYLLVPLVFSNSLCAQVAGGEAALTYHPFARWKVAGSYSYLQEHEQIKEGAPPGTQPFGTNSVPVHQGKVESFFNLTKAVQFDTLVFTSSSVLSSSVLGPGLPNMWLPPHTRLDVRLGWRVNRTVEISVSGQDLLSARHLELAPEIFTLPTDTVRGYYLKTTWHF